MNPIIEIKARLQEFDELEKEHRQSMEVWRDKVHESLTRGLESYEKWIFSIITLSSAILGFGGLSLLDSKHTQTVGLVYTSMFIFCIVIVFGLFHLKGRVEREVNGLVEQSKLINELRFSGMDELRETIVNTGGDIDQFREVYAQLQVKRKELLERDSIVEEDGGNGRKSHANDVLIYLFTAGLLTLGMAMIPIDIIKNALSMILEIRHSVPIQF